jgi:multidrug transporter EmrE-like cation transporter
MWFLLMLIILLTNGMSSFGLKVIAGWALPETVKFPYLTIWYAAGLASIGVPMVLKGERLHRIELLWGAVLAALSIAGQVAMAIALDSNVPGHIVFPVAIGGSIFIVALGERIFFRERMNRLNVIGVSLGFLAVILLGISSA